MIARLVLIALLPGCGGFEIDATVTSTSPLSQNGKPITSFEVDRTFDSFKAAEAAPVNLEVFDPTGEHEFDLRQFFDLCGVDVGTPTYLSLSLELSYTDCPVLVVAPGAQLGLCLLNERCSGTDGSSGGGIP